MLFLLWVYYVMFSLIIGLFRNRWLVAIVGVINAALVIISFRSMVEMWPQAREYLGYLPYHKLVIEYWQFMIFPAMPLIFLILGVVMSREGKLTWQEVLGP